MRLWRILSRAAEGFIDNDDLLRASALTFTVALSIVPILALAFSAVKGFGGADKLRPVVERYLALGGSGASEQVMTYIQNVNAAALGSAGGAFLLITVISTMGTVEQALNTIFNVPRSRSYFRKFSDYLSVLFTVPFLIVAALGCTAFFSVSISHFPFITHLAPYLFVWLGFFFLFVFFPYTQVRYGPALIGSFVTAVLFQIAQWGYVRFQVGVANYRAIYGAMASVPIFLVWIYVAWAIILFGAELTAALQRGDIRVSPDPFSPDFQISTTMYILLRLAERAAHGGVPVTSVSIGRELNVPEATLKPILKGLIDGGFVIEAEANANPNSHGLYLVRDPSTINLSEAVDAVIAGEVVSESDARINSVIGKIDSARREVLSSITLDRLRSTEAEEVETPTARISSEPEREKP